MAKKNYYAVKIGRTTGIFETWSECEVATKGYSGAQYAKFPTMEEAEAYLNGEDIYRKQIELDLEAGYVVAYTDGSYDKGTNRYAYGVCIIDKDKNEVNFCNTISYEAFATSQNISGEIFGVLTALDWALSNGYEKIKIYHDLEAISKWANGEYDANSAIAKYYVGQLSKRYDGYIQYEFVKVKGHSNNPYNDKADKLAASALKGERKLIQGANSFVVTSLKKDELETIIELIKEEDEHISETRKVILGGEQIKLKLSGKIYVTMKLYSTGKLLVQGKPNVLFQMVLTYISELLGEKQVVPLVKQAYRIKIDKGTVDSNYENFCSNLPESYNQSGKTLIRQAIVNLNGYFEAEEYGQYAYPALRALEGHIKYLLNKHGVQVVKTFSQFYETSNGDYALQATYSIPEPYKTNIEKCYNYYRCNRHKIFHFGDIIGDTDNTYLINTKEEADEIIRNAISLINTTAY